MKNLYRGFFLSIAVIFTFSGFVFSQSTEFTYQGRLLDNNLPMTAVYDFEFTLWNSLANGTQQGTTQSISGVSVTNGIFTVRLNFGAQFDGSARFLQIAVRSSGGGAYSTLAPRQTITSGPYAIRSLNSTTADTATNALNLGGVAAGQYVVTTDPRMTDSRNPLPNSGNYIWNQSAVQQPSSNFVISGNGDVGGTLAANVVRATTQYNIGVNRVLSVAGQENTFVGLFAGLNNAANANSFFGNSAGAANTTGIGNSFFGRYAGLSNIDGLANSFFGASAGRNNTTGDTNAFFGANAGHNNGAGNGNSFFGNGAGFANASASNNSFFGNLAGADNEFGLSNSFFGSNAGRLNTTGSFNSFFGLDAGRANLGGFNNSFIGTESGGRNETGFSNSFFGYRAGFLNDSGDNNTFLGYQAGNDNTTGSNNTMIGTRADVASNNLSNATAIGALSQVNCSDCLVLGSIAGFNGAGTSANVGIGTTSPGARLEVVNNGSSSAHVFVTSYGNVNNAIIGRQAGGTATTPTATTDGLSLFFLGGRGHTGTSFNTVSRVGIGMTASENWTSTANGTRITFETTANGTTNRVERMRIDHDGVISTGSLISSGTVSANNLFTSGLVTADNVLANGNVFVLGDHNVSGSISLSGNLSLGSLGAAGATNVCRNASNQLSTCSSSLRYKTNINRFGLGLKLINQLKPIVFDWKDGGMRDLGLGAEDVAAIEPLLVTYNNNGEVEGVKYDRIGVVAVNAIKEQQEIISRQQSAISGQKLQLDELRSKVEAQQKQIDALKKLVCVQNPTAVICEEEK